jgi:hypothetical protein
MPVESDADLLGMFDAQDFGVAATWRAGGSGAPVDVLVLRDIPTVDGTAFGMTVRAGAQILTVAFASVPALAKGDTFTIGVDVLTVQGAPRRIGPDGAVWEAEC